MTREDLERMFSYQAADAAHKYAEERCRKGETLSASKIEAFEAGAEWAQKFMISRAVNWLIDNTTWNYLFYGSATHNKDKIEKFVKAMEE